MTEPLTACRYCGNIHSGVCPLIKAMDFDESGALKRVEFFEQKTEQACQHPEQSRQDLSTMGNKRWQCKVCGYEHEEQFVNPAVSSY